MTTASTILTTTKFGHASRQSQLQMLPFASKYALTDRLLWLLKLSISKFVCIKCKQLCNILLTSSVSAEPNVAIMLCLNHYMLTFEQENKDCVYSYVPFGGFSRFGFHTADYDCS